MFHFYSSETPAHALKKEESVQICVNPQLICFSS